MVRRKTKLFPSPLEWPDQMGALVREPLRFRGLLPSHPGVRVDHIVNGLAFLEHGRTVAGRAPNDSRHI
jgi:hypothetical protein